MTDLVIANCHIVDAWDKFDAPVDATLAAMTIPIAPVHYDSSGNVTTSNGSDTTHNKFEGIATIKNLSHAGQATTVVRKGLLDVGNALSAMAIGDPVYLSDTDGTLATTAGTVSTQIGRVVPAWGALTADKLLLVGKGNY